MYGNGIDLSLIICGKTEGEATYFRIHQGNLSTNFISRLKKAARTDNQMHTHIHRSSTYRIDDVDLQCSQLIVHANFQ